MTTRTGGALLAANAGTPLMWAEFLHLVVGNFATQSPKLPVAV